jgi:Thiol:disulfide interchange protein DsbD, N-terminal
MRLFCAITVCLLAAGGCGASAVTSAPADRQALEGATADNGVEQRINDAPVAATLRLARGRAKAGDVVELSVKLAVAPTWEIHALDAPEEATATRLALDLPSGVEAQGEWQVPEPVRSVSPDGHAVYAGEAVFTRTLVVKPGATAGEQPIKCRVSYQACNERQCLRPTAVELAVALRVE